MENNTGKEYTIHHRELRNSESGKKVRGLSGLALMKMNDPLQTPSATTDTLSKIINNTLTHLLMCNYFYISKNRLTIA